MPQIGETVVVALSGGVDSATVAGLLVEQGHRVVGISMRLYDADVPAGSGRCCGPRDLEDARRVASRLGIPFYVVDYREEFRATVIENFLDEYVAGRTPNPCVRCNQHIKFTPLLRRARALGARWLATGHYARIVEAPDGDLAIARGRDPVKDQSYFLFHMPRAALGEVLFPLGDLTKAEVRQHAARLDLPVCDKPESQEICFVPDGDYAALVARSRPVAPGQIVDEAGAQLGAHQGIHHFTIGQRRGIGLSAPEPRYVLRVDPQHRLVVVGDRQGLDQTGFSVEDVVWSGPAPTPGQELRVAVQIRYRHRAEPARVWQVEPGLARVLMDHPTRAPAPGQAAVFYDGDDTGRIVGGGYIGRVGEEPRA